MSVEITGANLTFCQMISGRGGAARTARGKKTGGSSEAGHFAGNLGENAFPQVLKAESNKKTCQLEILKTEAL